jgi:hydrogenase small subunit
MKFCAGTAALLGLSDAAVPRIAKAVGAASGKPRVIWLSGQECTGCSISFINTSHPSTAEIVLDTISLRYHEAIMASSGYVADKVLEDTVKDGGYVLVVEGSIPKADDRYCMVAGKPFRKIVQDAARNAAAIIAVGSCATYGGIPRGTVSNGMGVTEFVKDKPVINLPMCPVHPEHVVGTIVYYLLYKKAPPMDAVGRPLLFHGNLIHENCERRGRFDNGQFLTDWNDPKQIDYCLYLKGCKGPFTYSDCAQRRWNNKLNWCVGCGAGCRGCAEPAFYTGMSPLYDKTKEIRGIKVETIGAVVTAVTAVGLAGHFIGQAATGRLGKGGPRAEGGEK